MSELEPVFVVSVVLDGDDDAQTQTGNVRDALDSECQRMLSDGLVRGYTLKEQTQ